MEDTYRHKGMRKNLIDSLRRKGIQDEKILAAMEALPRHYFLEKAFDEWAYKDQAFPIGEEQTISQPFTVAFQTELLKVKKREKILEVGTGSGYQAGILSMLGAKVYTIERQGVLYHKTKKLLQEIGLGNIKCYLKDGYQGLPAFAPFDKILVTAGAEEIPPVLKTQLKIGGILVIPVGKKVQKMIRLIRIGENEFREEIRGKFRFVPLLKGLRR